MKYGILEIDHFIIGVKDPANANVAFESLGFTVSPLSDLELGVSSRCIFLTPQAPQTANYIELVGVTDPLKVQAEIAAMLSGDEGIKQIVISTSDARAAYGALESDGYELSPFLELERKWAFPSGETVDLAFSVILPIPGSAPFRWNLFQDHTPQYFYGENLRGHANGAQVLDSVYCVSEKPEQDARFYEKLYEAEAVRSRRGIILVGPGHVQMRIVSPNIARNLFPDLPDDALQSPPYMAGFSVGVADVLDTRRYLSESAVSFHISPRGTLYVEPGQAHGILIEFEQSTLQ